MKKSQEKKNALLAEMNAILDKCEQENRSSLAEDELTEYNRLSDELQGVVDFIEKKKALRSAAIEGANASNDEDEDEGERTEDDAEGNDGEEEADETSDEVRSFVNHIRGINDESIRSGELKFGDNGVVVPKTIAKKVIRTLENICPIYEKATKFHFKGEVVFPVLDESTSTVVCDYAEEFNELTSKTPKFEGITLKGYLVGALALVSRSLINNAEVNVLSIIISTMALAAKRFFEENCLIGDGSKMQGVLMSDNVVTAPASNALTIDDLIDVQGKIIDEHQNKCVWIMHPTTRDALRKLKDENGRYYFNCDVTTGFKPMILNKEVFVSDKMPKIGADSKCVFYGDPSGLYVNMREQISTQILREKYATMHAIGVNMWFECDSKIVEKQKLAVLKCAAS